MWQKTIPTSDHHGNTLIQIKLSSANLIFSTTKTYIYILRVTTQRDREGGGWGLGDQYCIAATFKLHTYGSSPRRQWKKRNMRF